MTIYWGNSKQFRIIKLKSGLATQHKVVDIPTEIYCFVFYIADLLVGRLRLLPNDLTESVPYSTFRDKHMKGHKKVDKGSKIERAPLSAP